MQRTPASIDVVIRTFNRPHKLRRALQSLRHQTCPPSSVYVVDNGTNPVTRQVVESESAKAEGVTVIHYLRSRVGSSRTAAGVGIGTSTADWIILLCDDDFLHPERIREDRWIIETLPANTVLIQHSFLRADYRHRRVWLHRVSSGPVPLASALLFRGMGPPGSCTFKGEPARNHHPFFKEVGVGDYDLYAALLEHGQGMGSPFLGFVMDDTRIPGRETTMGTQLVGMVLEHERRYAHLAPRALLPPDEFRRILRQEAAFYLGKALGLKAFSSSYREIALEQVQALITGMLAFMRQRYFYWLPMKSRGSVSLSFSGLRRMDPEMADLVETNELPE